MGRGTPLCGQCVQAGLPPEQMQAEGTLLRWCDPEDHKALFSSMVVDITDRKKTETALLSEY